MAIIDRELTKQKRVVKLYGPEGNAFRLLAIAKEYAKAEGWSDQRIDFLMKEMMSSDYENVVQTLDKNFGQHLLIVRNR